MIKNSLDVSDPYRGFVSRCFLRLCPIIVLFAYCATFVLTTYSQEGYIVSMTCDGSFPFLTPCYSSEINARANINFHIQWYGLTEGFEDAYYWTEVHCPNGRSVQNNSEVGDGYIAAWGLSNAAELVNYNTVWQTNPLSPTTYWSTGLIVPGMEFRFLELCYSGGWGGSGGGCSFGRTVTGELVNKDDPPSSDVCSPCNPTPEETNCPYGGVYDWVSCQCGGSPIIIDVFGNGFNLTNVVNGVQFDLDGNGVRDQYSWSSMGSDDAWLAIDRNGNGIIDNGKELFGNYTDQPTPSAGVKKNGFLALAVYDMPENGGNDDGKIGVGDLVHSRLRLWQDVNHNGISEIEELHSLLEIGIKSINLDYKVSRKHDEFGNAFRYRSKVTDANDAQLGRWAWDVYLMRESN